MENKWSVFVQKVNSWNIANEKGEDKDNFAQSSCHIAQRSFSISLEESQQWEYKAVIAGIGKYLVNTQ